MFPIQNPAPTSLSTGSLWVFPVHQARALVSCIPPGLVICFTLDNIHVSMLFSRNIPPSPSLTESKSLFCTSVPLFLFCFSFSFCFLSLFSVPPLETIFSCTLKRCFSPSELCEFPCACAPLSCMLGCMLLEGRKALSKNSTWQTGGYHKCILFPGVATIAASFYEIVLLLLFNLLLLSAFLPPAPSHFIVLPTPAASSPLSSLLIMVALCISYSTQIQLRLTFCFFPSFGSYALYNRTCY